MNNLNEKFNEDRFRDVLGNVSVDFDYENISEDEFFKTNCKSHGNKLFEFIHSFCMMDEIDFKIVRQKLKTPAISFRDMGMMLGMSKEAVDKRIKHICQYSPLWFHVLRNIKKRGGRSVGPS